MKKLYFKNKIYFYKIFLFVLIIFNFTYVISYAYITSTNKYLYTQNTNTINLTTKKNNELIKKFQPIIENIFLNKNSTILSCDNEGLKLFYDLNKNVSKWAYEKEITKVKYFTNWCEKQCVSFTKINSISKICNVTKIDKDTYNIVCYASTTFSYMYKDQPNIENSFKLGTCHYINLKDIGNRYIILKEWYTDPLADSLDLDNINCNDIKKTILNHKNPEYKPNIKIQKAINYAHEYCGISDNIHNLFKYNKNYKNFNPDGGDCANFASQIMYESGAFKKNLTWNYYGKSATKSWINAQSFKNYLINSGRGSYIDKGSYCETYKSAFDLRPGDIVAYEKKGRITHVSTVTGLDSKGYPLVTCHNTDRMLVPYDLGWSNSNIKFHFINIHY